MADRYSERGGTRWEDSERRFRDRDRDYGDGDRGFLERFADEMRSWFGNEEAQRRRMMDEREDWRGERGDASWRDRGRGDWGRGEWGRGGWGRGESGRSDWGRGESGRGESGRGDWSRGDWGRTTREWMHGPDEREWGRDWGWVEGRGRGAGSGTGGYGTAGGYGTIGYGTGFSGYGGWGRERDWGHESRESGRGGRDWMGASGPYGGRGPRNYQRSDERIREDLCERFTQHSHLDPSDIDVRVQNGEVTLDGTVHDRWAKRTAEDLAEGVWGVKEVHNKLRVVQVELGQERREDRDDQARPGPQRGSWAA